MVVLVNYAINETTRVRILKPQLLLGRDSTVADEAGPLESLPWMADEHDVLLRYCVGSSISCALSPLIRLLITFIVITQICLTLTLMRHHQHQFPMTF